MSYEFKGNNDYSQEVLADVSRDLSKVIKILSDIDHNFAFVEGCELEYEVVKKCYDLLCITRDNLYINSRQGGSQ